jgi:conjugal transfer pilus assembly protein TraA
MNTPDQLNPAGADADAILDATKDVSAATTPPGGARGWPAYVGRFFATLLYLVLVGVVVVACALPWQQTPSDAFKQVFEGVTAPMGLPQASDMVDTNTWLTVHWDRTLAESFRTGRTNVSVDIVSSLPATAADAAHFATRDDYLALFKAGKLHKVAERATLTFERHGLSWTLEGAKPEQFSAQARTAAWLTRATQGPLTFVSDAGVYTDDAPYSSMRVDENHFGNFLGLALAVTMLLMGAGLMVAKNSPWPALTGMLGAVVVFWGPGWIAGFALPGTVALAGVQALGFFH